MISYSTGSMLNAAKNIQARIDDIYDQLAKMDDISANVEGAIKGSQAGAKLGAKILDNKKKLTDLAKKLEAIVPILNETTKALEQNDKNIVEAINNL